MAPAAFIACWYSRTSGIVLLLGKGTTWLMATPVPSAPRVLRLPAVASTDSAYICSPLRDWLTLLITSMVGLPARPSTSTSGCAPSSVVVADAASLALFSTETAATALSLRCSSAAFAASSTSLPKLLFW